MLTTIPIVLNKWAGQEPTAPDGMYGKHYFHLAIDGGKQLKQDMIDAGFERIKIWEQPSNVYFSDGAEFMDKMGDHWLEQQFK